MHETALCLSRRGAKHLSIGVTLVVGGGLPLGALRGVVSSAGENLDVVTFSWGTAVVPGEIEVKTALPRGSGIDCCPGGALLEEHVPQESFRSAASLSTAGDMARGGVERDARAPQRRTTVHGGLRTERDLLLHGDDQGGSRSRTSLLARGG